MNIIDLFNYYCRPDRATGVFVNTEEDEIYGSTIDAYVKNVLGAPYELSGFGQNAYYVFFAAEGYLPNPREERSFRLVKKNFKIEEV